MVNKKENFWRMIGMLIPIVVSAIMIAVQWGIVTNQMANFGNRIDKSERTIEKLSDILMNVQKDVAFIKGKMK